MPYLGAKWSSSFHKLLKANLGSCIVHHVVVFLYAHFHVHTFYACYHLESIVYALVCSLA